MYWEIGKLIRRARHRVNIDGNLCKQSQCGWMANNIPAILNLVDSIVCIIMYIFIGMEYGVHIHVYIPIFVTEAVYD